MWEDVGFFETSSRSCALTDDQGLDERARVIAEKSAI
jgi:hypothetical protein